MQELKNNGVATVNDDPEVVAVIDSLQSRILGMRSELRAEINDSIVSLHAELGSELLDRIGTFSAEVKKAHSEIAEMHADMEEMCVELTTAINGVGKRMENNLDRVDTRLNTLEAGAMIFVGLFVCTLGVVIFFAPEIKSLMVY